MTYPSELKEVHLNSETDKKEMRIGSYEFLNPPGKNLVSELELVTKDIKCTIICMYASKMSSYDKKAHQKHKKRMIGDSAPRLRRINHEQKSTKK